jgi:hypothetical protein
MAIGLASPGDPTAHPPLDAVAPDVDVHTPLLHAASPAHWFESLHILKHWPLVESQRYGSHVCADVPSIGTDCVPSALHVAVIAEHAPDEQKKPCAQSLFAMHDVPHFIASAQTYGAHARVVPVPHEPLPSQ